MRFDDLQSEHGYDAMEAYCRSKLANVLFTRELAKRLGDRPVTANAAHPGPVRSGFGMDGDLTGFMGFGMKLVRPFEISPKRGAKTSIYLASSPEVAGRTGLYWVRSKPGHMSRRARDDEAADPAVDRERGAALVGRLCRWLDQPAKAPTTWVMHAQTDATSSGSMAGNMAMRNWLRPSFR